MGIKQTYVAVILFLLFTFLAVPERSSAASPAAPIFVFHTDEFWLNLHHFLYVLGRASNKTTDSAREAVSSAPADQEQGFSRLTPAEVATWKEAVAAYASSWSRRDVVFDVPLPAVANALARARDTKSLSAPSVERDLSAVLEKVAPIYRKAWWADHHRANQAWHASIKKLVDRHGQSILALITGAYQMQWPATGFNVHITAYSNWAGAYSTDGDLLVLASRNPSTQGEYGLETIFHEGIHQWDTEVDRVLTAASQKAGKKMPRGLSHAIVFYTAGEAVRRSLPGHIPYAEKAGVWGRGMITFKAPLEEFWQKYLDKKIDRETALAEILKKVGT